MKTYPWIVKLGALALLLSISFGCKTYMKLKYGVTQPKEETPLKLVSFLEKHHFPTENLYIFSDSAYFNQEMRNPMFRKYLLSHIIFDREGTLLQHDTTECQWAGYDKLKSLRSDSAYKKCNELKLSHILGLIKPFGKDSLSFDLSKEPDFTVIVIWAKFIGTYNYRLFELSEAIQLNKTARIRVIWLNVDMQESWKLTPDQKVALK